MSRTLLLPGAFALLATSVLPAQNPQYYRPTSDADAPRVRVFIDGQRSLSPGSPVRIRFEVDENAFVAVVRVDGNGRMQILFPYSRTQRSAVRGGQTYYARNPRLGGEASFIANDRMGGYVFAVASYAPLDFSSFENKDYDRFGAYSAFTVANRSISRRPDVYIERFAARVLWDVDTPYDYDVDYYFQNDYGIRNTYALCSAMFQYGAFPYFGSMNSFMWDWDSWGYDYSYPSRSMCRNYYNGLHCFSYFSYGSFGCNIGAIIASGPTGPIAGQPTEPGFVPNEGVVKGGLFTPTPLPVPTEGGDAPPVERFGRFDQIRGTASDLDDIKSIPARATQKLKDEDARRDGSTRSGATTGFDRADRESDKDKTRTADATTSAQPPAREPTKTKAEPETRRSTRSRGTDFGTTSRPTDTRSKPTPVSNPSPERTTGSSSGTSNPPSISGAATTEKKKPPQD